MNSIELPIFFEERRLKAVREALAADGLTVEDKLHETFNFLYEQLVPAEHRTVIEAEIQKEEADAAAALEARRRFSVIHVRENGEDAYFTSDLFLSFMSAAYRYRLYSRDELSDEHKSFADAFIETNQIVHQDYESLCDKMPNDFRITVLLDFDIDGGAVSVCDSSDNAWWTYNLHDVSVAAFKAFRSDYRPTDERERIFNSALAQKEIHMDSEDEIAAEDLSHNMQM